MNVTLVFGNTCGTFENFPSPIIWAIRQRLKVKSIRSCNTDINFLSHYERKKKKPRHKQNIIQQNHQNVKLRIYLKAIAMSFPNFSRALSIISRGDAFSRSFAICSKSSSSFSTSANHTPNNQNTLESPPIKRGGSFISENSMKTR